MLLLRYFLATLIFINITTSASGVIIFGSRSGYKLLFDTLRLIGKHHESKVSDARQLFQRKEGNKRREKDWDPWRRRKSGSGLGLSCPVVSHSQE